MSGQFNIQDIQELLEILKQNDVCEFKLDRGEERLWLKRGEQVNYPKHLTQNFMQSATGGRVEEQTSSTNTQQLAQANSTAGLANGSAGSSVNTATNGAASVPPTVNKNIKEIQSPMVGTFYRRPAVDAEPYVVPGDTIKKGDVLCIVEAMKVMNEIEAEISGKVLEVCLEDGQMVEYGEVIFRVEINS